MGTRSENWFVAFVLIMLFFSGFAIRSVSAEGEFVTIDFSKHHNYRYQDTHSAFPEGLFNLGGVPFDIPIGGNNYWRHGTSGSGGDGVVVFDIDVGVSNVREVHTLITTLWGTTQSGRMVLEFFGSDTAYFQKDMIGNDDIRDWGLNFTGQINGATTINVVDVGSPPVPHIIDKQAIALPSDFYDEELVFIRITDDRTTFVHGGILAGVTVSRLTCLVGDVNRDGVVNLLDVEPLVNLVSVGEFQCEADLDCDGAVTLLDVDLFIALLSGE